jgi:hypothetical protein
MKYLAYNKICLILILCLMLKNVEPSTEEKGQIQAISNKSDNEQLYTTSPVIVKSIPVPVTTVTNTLFKSSPPLCPCASLITCPPCGIIVKQTPSYSQCPCAPKNNCPVCPPLSLIHEMAAKKALADQKLVYGLRGYTSSINKLLDNIMKYSGDVVNYEMKSKDMAQKMEEASLKAQLARQNMFKVILNIIYSR